MRRILAFIFTALNLAALCPTAAAGPLGFELRAGPWLGLDRPLRGGSLAAGASLGLGGVVPGLRARMDYDSSLGSLIAGAELSLGFGNEIALVLGGELPLGALSLETDGARIALTPRSWPNRFGIAAVLAEIAPRRAGRPGLCLETELSWSAYGYADDAQPGLGPEAASGVAGFSAGFRAFLGLVLSWKP
ncbi:MAG TPA: hypothetical protein VFL04_05470 [Rectinemataceae bacterium]|nr:hypothetical protein [Rectinemataceae bacterium]